MPPCAARFSRPFPHKCRAGRYRPSHKPWRVPVPFLSNPVREPLFLLVARLKSCTENLPCCSMVRKANLSRIMPVRLRGLLLWRCTALTTPRAQGTKTCPTTASPYSLRKRFNPTSSERRLFLNVELWHLRSRLMAFARAAHKQTSRMPPFQAGG